MKAMVRCNCGQRIFSRDVVQQGYYMRQFGPSYVYLRFRCSRCKKLGEHFIKQEDWEDGLLSDELSEMTSNEKRRLDGLGNITLDEMVHFHYALDKLDKLPQRVDDE